MIGGSLGGDILDRWPDLVDARTGIVRDVRELRLEEDEPAFVHYLSTAASTAAWNLLPNFGDNGGVGTDRPTAIRKALGEAVERYCSAIFDYDELTWATYETLARRAAAGHGPRPVDPETFALYSAEQLTAPGFPWRPFRRDTPVAWTPGRALDPDLPEIDVEPVLVPAGFVFVPYHYLPQRPDTPVTQPISTGLACGAGAADAAVSALCEVIERDAFTITWQRRLSRPRWDPATLPAPLPELLRRFTDAGLAVHVVDITTDIPVPTVLTVAVGRADTSPAVAVAAATHPDPVSACRKSLEELAHTRRFASQVMDYLPAVPLDVEAGHPAVTGQREHLRSYCPQEATARAAFLWAGPVLPFPDEPTDLGGPPADRLRRLVTAVIAAGEQVFACELTTPDIAELGLSVMRVVVPGLHPLHMGHGNRARGGHRLRTVPDRLPHPCAAVDDNPYPHPFP